MNDDLYAKYNGVELDMHLALARAHRLNLSLIQEPRARANMRLFRNTLRDLFALYARCQKLGLSVPTEEEMCEAISSNPELVDAYKKYQRVCAREYKGITDDEYHQAEMAFFGFLHQMNRTPF